MGKFDLASIIFKKQRVAIVTGANIGLGFETALVLADKKFKVILACRNLEKAETAKASILQQVTHAEVEVMQLDLSRLQSVREFAANFTAKYDQLHLLINNAGIMMPPYSLTEDGFESQLGTNYLGHFLLTNLLFETLEKSKGARVVSVSSLAHDWGEIYFEDMQFEQGYDARKAYGQSKLACLMFAYEFQKRLRSKRSVIISVAAHPGVSYTNLGQHLPKYLQSIGKLIRPLISQSAKDGALPILRAALDPKVIPGKYYGPGGLFQLRGEPRRIASNRLSKNVAIASQLWTVSEELTQLPFTVKR